MTRFDHDVLVVGSGFGGSVTALRLTEKGYRVAVLEAGRRWDAETLPETNWDVRNFLWEPALGLRGMQKIDLLHDVGILSIAGVGGGSLLYACTLYRPADEFYTDRQWADLSDWQDELAPFYDQAERMLGANDTPFDTAADRAMQEIGDRLGVGDTFRPTPVGIWFGEPGVEVTDPYFGGEGPTRTGCIGCGGCMVGCRFNSKNTLDSNYLYLAERNGAVIHPERTVIGIRALPGGGYRVISERSGSWARRELVTHTAEQVVLSAGVLGTVRLLFDMRERGALPNVSDALGHLTRTNSEALLGAISDDDTVDHSYGHAITSSVHPDDFTHLEPFRYSAGSNFMYLLGTILVDKEEGVPRWRSFLREAAEDPRALLRNLRTKGVAQRTVGLLVMQSLDNSLELTHHRGVLGSRLRSRTGHGNPNPSYIPIGYDAARDLAEIIGGSPMGNWTESLLDIPMTAHIIGGATIGGSAEDGVVDPYHRVFGHPGLHIADASVITANLGANPSLTITALAERAMAMWPNNGDDDPRPALGSPYRRIAPVAPDRPAVPADAPAALRLPMAPADA